MGVSHICEMSSDAAPQETLAQAGSHALKRFYVLRMIACKRNASVNAPKEAAKTSRLLGQAHLVSSKTEDFLCWYARGALQLLCGSCPAGAFLRGLFCAV